MKYSQYEASPHSSKQYNKQKKSKPNSSSDLARRFNEIYRTSPTFHPESLYRQLSALTLRLCQLLTSQKNKKIQFDQILINNLRCGSNIKSRKIVALNVKVSALYIKSGLNLQATKQYLQNSLHQQHIISKKEDFFVNLIFLNQCQKKNIFTLAKETINSFFDIFSFTCQNQSEQDIFKQYFSQAKSIQSLQIFSTLLQNYLRSFLNQSGGFVQPKLQINMLMQYYLSLIDSQKLITQLAINNCMIICNRYGLLYRNPQYRKYMRFQIQKTFSCIVSLMDKLNNQRINNQIICLFCFLFELDQIDLVYKSCSLQQQLNQFRCNTLAQNLKFISILYINLTEESICRQQKVWISILNVLEKNISKIVINDRNVYYLLTKIINKVQTLKNQIFAPIYIMKNLISIPPSKQIIQVMSKCQNLIRIMNIFMTNSLFLTLGNRQFQCYLPSNMFFQIGFRWVECLALQNKRNVNTLTQTLISWLQKINPDNEDYHKIVENLIYLFTLTLNTQKIGLSLVCLKILLSWQGLKNKLCLKQEVLKLYKKILQRIQQNWKFQQNQSEKKHKNKYKKQTAIQNSFFQIIYLLCSNFLQYLSKQKYHRTLAQNNLLKEMLSKTVILVGIHKKQYMEDEYHQLKNKITQILKLYPQSLQLILFSLEYYAIKILQPKFQVQSKIIKGFIQFYSEFNCLYERGLVQNLTIISFLMHLKYIIRSQEYLKITDLQTQILSCEKKILNTSIQKYIRQIKLDRNSTDIELMIDLLAKKSYLHVFYQQNISIQLINANYNDQNTFSNFFQKDENLQKENKNQDQLKNQDEHTFEKCQTQLQNSCIILSKIKRQCANIVPILLKQIQKLSKQTDYLWKIEIYSIQLNSFKNILQFLKQSWNIIWLLQNLDMRSSMDKIVSLRLGILYQISKITQNYDSFYLQVSKKMFLNILPNKKYIYYTAKSQQCKKLINLFLNKEIKNLRIKNRFQKAIYVFNNINCYVNLKTIIGYLASYIFVVQKKSILLPDQMLEQQIPILNYLTKFSILNREVRVNSCMNVVREHFQELNQIQLCYPFLTLCLVKLLKLLKMHNQLSQMKSILKIGNIYCSKVGNLNVYHQIIECLLLKKYNPNILKIIDCYKTVIQSYDFKAFGKIDKILCNKRRSMSVNFNIKVITNLLKDAIYTQESYRKSLTQIILLYFKDQLNLYPYQVKAVQLILKQQQNKQFTQNIMSKHEYQNKHKYQKQIQCQLQKQSLNIVQNKKILQTLKKQQVLQRIFNFVNRLAIIAYQNYQNGIILQSIIGYYISLAEDNCQFTSQQNQTFERLIAKIIILMMEFNYEFKKICYRTEEFNLLDDDIQLIAQNIKLSNQLIQNLKNKSKTQLDFKINYLQKHLVHPLSIIYPIRNNIYNLTFCNGYFMSSASRFNFQDVNQTFNTLIKNQELFLKKQIVDRKDWWTKRLGVDRQLGKISENVDIGILDSKLNRFDPKYSNILKLSKKLIKFVGFNKKYYEQHLQKFIEKQKISSIGKDQIIKQIQILNQLEEINSRKKKSILIYIYDNYFQFPFQNQKQMRKFEGVYRLPSISYLIQNTDSTNGVGSLPKFNFKSVAYLVNTLNDLKQTQQSFYDIKQLKNIKSHSWQGQIGLQPTFTRMKQLLTKKQVFLYMGHGTGVSHLKQKQFSSINLSNLMMLFGCGSIKLTKNNSQLHGISLLYLINGCKSLLGCLWSVTDKDTDFLTQQIFRQLKEKPQNLSELLQRCKKNMKMKYINGSALVVLGLPCQIYCK